MDPTIIVAAIGALTAIIVAIVQQRQGRKMSEQGRRVSEVHEQVKNTHSTYLREDIDKLLLYMMQHTKDIADLKDDALITRKQAILIEQRLAVMEQQALQLQRPVVRLKRSDNGSNQLS